MKNTDKWIIKLCLATLYIVYIGVIIIFLSDVLSFINFDKTTNIVIAIAIILYTTYLYIAGCRIILNND